MSVRDSKSSDPEKDLDFISSTKGEVYSESVFSHELVNGAPEETISPLGYHVDWISVIFLVNPSLFWAMSWFR